MDDGKENKMNKTSLVKVLLSVIILILLLMACRPKPPRGYVNNFERFVERVEKNASSCSEEQWERNDKQFRGFIERYKTEKQKLSPEENKKIGRLMARYAKAKLRRGIIIDAFKEVKGWFDCLVGFKEEISDYKSIIQGFLDEIEDSIEKDPDFKHIYYFFKKYLENN